MVGVLCIFFDNTKFCARLKLMKLHKCNVYFIIPSIFFFNKLKLFFFIYSTDSQNQKNTGRNLEQNQVQGRQPSALSSWGKKKERLREKDMKRPQTISNVHCSLAGLSQQIRNMLHQSKRYLYLMALF